MRHQDCRQRAPAPSRTLTGRRAERWDLARFSSDRPRQPAWRTPYCCSSGFPPATRGCGPARPGPSSSSAAGPAAGSGTCSSRRGLAAGRLSGVRRRGAPEAEDLGSQAGLQPRAGRRSGPEWSRDPPHPAGAAGWLGPRCPAAAAGAGGSRRGSRAGSAGRWGYSPGSCRLGEALFPLRVLCPRVSRIPRAVVLDRG